MTYLPHRIKTALLVLAALLMSANACGSTIPRVKIPGESLRIAAMHIKEASLDIPDLVDAKVESSGYVMLRPGLTKPAYYEILLKAANGTRVGFIVVATSDHDRPVVQWSLQRASNIEKLEKVLTCEFDGNRDRLYLIDDVTFAAVTSNGVLCGFVGNGIRLSAAADWKNFESDWIRQFVNRNPTTDKEISMEWAEVRARLSGNKQRLSLFKCKAWKYHWAGGGDRVTAESQQMLYRQLSPHELPNNTKCASGCGATAWAMLFGWVDRQAAVGNHEWRNNGKIFGDKSTPPPTDMSGEIPDAIWEIQGDLDTECFGDQGYTLPNNMANAGKFLARRGYSKNDVSVEWQAINSWDMRDRADATIKDGSPAVIQLGMEHYPLAFGYRKIGVSIQMRRC